MKVEMTDKEYGEVRALVKDWGGVFLGIFLVFLLFLCLATMANRVIETEDPISWGHFVLGAIFEIVFFGFYTKAFGLPDSENASKQIP